MPIRWRLAGGSAALTFVILASFAVLVGALTSRQVRTQFDDQLTLTAQRVGQELDGALTISGTHLNCGAVALDDFAAPDNAVIRIFDASASRLLCADRGSGAESLRTPLLSAPPSPSGQPYNAAGYRVAVRTGIRVRPHGTLTLLYAQPLSDVNHTLARIQVFLLLGVLGGSVLALLAGLFVSDRATAPIKELTGAAREIARTRDPRRRIPHPEAEDEIAELARTLEEMLGSLEASRQHTQAMLDRQREFVADASHELRTPLTSVLANLELLTEELEDQPAQTAEAALRATRRMRRLVGDLLLLARGDAARGRPHRRTDLGEVLLEAAAELGLTGEDHALRVRADPAPVQGVRDELHRLVLNLLENAMRHTPPGTAVRAVTEVVGDEARLLVEDDGPGIPPELAERVFDRFVRGGRDGGRGTGLGLAIVRSVAESHAGSVALEPAALANAGQPGTRFLVRLPLAAGAPNATPEDEPRAPGGGSPDTGGETHVGADARAAAGTPVAQTSTTTGRTIGRRRNRS